MRQYRSVLKVVSTKKPNFSRSIVNFIREQRKRETRQRIFTELAQKRVEEAWKIRWFAACRHENRRETVRHSSNANPFGKVLVLHLQKKKTCSPFRVFSLCITMNGGLNVPVEVSQNLRHLIFIRSRTNSVAQIGAVAALPLRFLAAVADNCHGSQLANKLQVSHSRKATS